MQTPTSKLKTALRYAVPALATLLLLSLLYAVANGAFGQSLDTDARLEADIWGNEVECYQHTMEATGEVEGQWGPVFTEVFIAFRWWGACDAKIASSFLNAESAKVYERRHGANIGIEWRIVQAGGTIRRRAVHHVWRHRHRENRHGHFPHDNSVRNTIERCQSGRRCAGIGYWDGVRPYIGVETSRLDISLSGPQWTWKDLTLPWPDWILRGEYDHAGWVFGVEAQIGGLAEPSASLDVERHVTNMLHIGASIGRDATPGWKSVDLDRITIKISLR